MAGHPAAEGKAARSGLVRLLREGHQGVTLAREELERITCWIDLGVPYCGDYGEANAWDERGRARYAAYLAKRRAMETIEAAQLRRLRSEKPAASAPGASAPGASAPEAGRVLAREADAYRDLAAGLVPRPSEAGRVLDFGRTVEVDRVVLSQRPGNGPQRVTLDLGEGQRRTVLLRPGVGAEDVMLGKVASTSMLRLRDGEGVIRVEAWGRDPVPVGTDPEAAVGAGPR